MFIDKRREFYVPIIKPNDADGIRFDSFEVIFKEHFSNLSKKNDLIDFIKYRTL